MVSTALPNLSTAVTSVVSTAFTHQVYCGTQCATTGSTRVVTAVKTNQLSLNTIFGPRLCTFGLDFVDKMYIPVIRENRNFRSCKHIHPALNIPPPND